MPDGHPWGIGVATWEEHFTAAAERLELRATPGAVAFWRAVARLSDGATVRPPMSDPHVVGAVARMELPELQRVTIDLLALELSRKQATDRGCLIDPEVTELILEVTPHIRRRVTEVTVALNA